MKRVMNDEMWTLFCPDEALDAIAEEVDEAGAGGDGEKAQK
jgi:hypothetical protein